jgi:hypothetical protein
MSLSQRLEVIRRKPWIAGGFILLLAAAIVIKIITSPLEVSANVGDGDQSVARTAAIDLKFSQDMLSSSVQSAFSISPSVAVSFKAVSPREFQFRPQMQPSTAYTVNLKDAESTGHSKVSRSFSFKTEAAPTVSSVTVNGQAVKDGQQLIPPKGDIKLNFSQAMDSGKTPILLNGKPVPATWSSDSKTATLKVTLAHSHPYPLTVPQAALNQKQDPFLADWKLTFTTVIEVPSQGDSNRIGSGAPVIVQIENSQAARPQNGMQEADMVYEYESEGSVPRLTAVYWHPLPSLVGPVRSCRLITIRIEMMYRGMIYCSGANDYVLGKVWQWPNLVNDYSNGKGGVFYRANPPRYAPHNVMMRGSNTTNYTAQWHLAAPTYDIAGKHPDGTFQGDPATQISVPDHGAVWRYDAGSHQYKKWQDGAPFMNIGTGQVHAKTVIVQYVTSYLDTNPANMFHGYYTEAYEMTGTGKADIFVDGVVIHGSWYHPDPNVPTVYLDQNGEPIELDNGLTWVHVIGSQKWHLP